MKGIYTTALKPCPFCGGDYLQITRSDYEGSKWATIECCTCHANIRNPNLTEDYEEARAQVIEAWNRRDNG